jgi:hypothetical protein
MTMSLKVGLHSGTSSQQLVLNLFNGSLFGLLGKVVVACQIHLSRNQILNVHGLLKAHLQRAFHSKPLQSYIYPPWLCIQIAYCLT